ncbi:MAG: SoxR reducing system RseC family protein [Clostridia bacterium]|nr:SoxR reducing system RseC family protein [Clostridia bacterium]
MRKRGIVKTAGNMAEVSIIRETACGENCANCGGCVAGETVIRAENTVGAKVGDKVVLEIPDRAALGAASIAYILPIAVLLISITVTSLCGVSEGGSALFTLAALALCFLAVRAFAKRKGEHFAVRIVEILY